MYCFVVVVVVVVRGKCQILCEIEKIDFVLLLFMKWIKKFQSILLVTDFHFKCPKFAYEIVNFNKIKLLILSVHGFWCDK